MSETMDSGLDTAEFADNARRVVAAYAGQDPSACTRLLGEAGLLGVLAAQAAGGQALPPRFALPLLEAAGAGDLGFPLLETLLLARHLAGPAPEVAAALVAGAARGSIAWAGALPQPCRAPMAAGADWLLLRHGSGAALACRQAGGLDLTAPEDLVEASATTPVAQLDAAAWAALPEEAMLLRAGLILGTAGHCLGTKRDRNDVFAVEASIPGEAARRPAAESACTLLRAG